MLMRRKCVMKIKKLMALCMSMLMCVSVAACGSSDSSSSSHVDQIEVPSLPTADEDDENALTVSGIPEGEATELEWLSYFDLNSENGSETSTEMALFNNFGGTVKYTRTTSMNKYEKLANRLMSNDPPDMFWYEKKMTFPVNCLQNMFQPVDPIVNFDDPLWVGVKDTAQQFSIDGNHYVAPITFNITSLLTYDADRIEDLGADDPYELYLKDEWDWNAMEEIMQMWVSNAPADEPRYGVNGWFHSFIFQTTGETLIQFNPETGEYENNIYSANLERAANWLYNISKDGLVETTWYGSCKEAFNAGILFYSMGPWASTGTGNGPTDSDNWKNVLIPRDPNTDDYYMAIDTSAYMWVYGSKKNAAMKCWLECCRMACVDDGYVDISRQKFFVNTPNWTDEMYELAYNPLQNDKITVIYDPGYGISSMLSDDDAATNDSKEAVIPYMYSSVSKADEDGSQFTWASLRDEYNNTINSELAIFNEKLANFDVNSGVQIEEEEESSESAAE